jgi:superfamily I DNA/RNA helicase
MTFIAVTQGTAEWLLGKSDVLNAAHDALVTDPQNVKRLSLVEFAEGPFRMSASKDGRVLAVWNSDYLTGTDDESWGFLQLDGMMGLGADATISHEVLERELYIVLQRLQGLLVDPAFMHKKQPNGAHTVLAGRGTSARKSSVAYVETSVEEKGTARRAVVCVGPAKTYASVSKAAIAAGSIVDQLLSCANALIAVGRQKELADLSFLPALRDVVRGHVRPTEAVSPSEIEVETTPAGLVERFSSVGLTYDQWIEPTSPLNEVQRRILLSDAIESQPLRIVGPGGSGKTLLMQLLAVRRLRVSRERGEAVRVLYVVHNSAMAETVKQRFGILDPDVDEADAISLRIDTLAAYGQRELNLANTTVIDPDAQEAKRFQYDEVRRALKETFSKQPDAVSKSSLLKAVSLSEDLMRVFTIVVMSEISTAIKGHGLESDRRKYIQSERPLSRLHGVLNEGERDIVYAAFEEYHKRVFEEYGVLDSDDIALSLLGRLRTPIWELKRTELAFDYVFVDETQLFNENERRVLPLLTRKSTSHVPIVLALDEAQNVYGQTTAGLATLGITDIASENLAAIQRSTREIVALAFFVIQRTTDLFGPEFPKFTGLGSGLESSQHPVAAKPRVERAGPQQKTVARLVLKRIRDLRKENVRSIAVICHAEAYWESLRVALGATDLPLRVLQARGEKLPNDAPVVVLTRPIHSGGHEFDAVVLVGLEQGLVPPRIPDNVALASAVEQQTLREIYLAVTRARYRVIVALSAGATLTPVLQDAVRNDLLDDPGIK